MLVRIRSRLEADGKWHTIDGWSSTELEVLPRVGEFISLQHIVKQGVWLRVDHIVHTPNNVRPVSLNDERPYQAILFVTWLSPDAVIAPDEPPQSLQVESQRCIRRALADHSGTHPLPAFSRRRRPWRQ